MANSLNKLFVLVPANTISGYGDKTGTTAISAIESASSTNSSKIYFVADTNEILVRGVHYGLNNSADVKALQDAIGTSTDAATAETIWGKITALSAFSGKSLVTTVSASTAASDDNVATEKAVATAVEAAVTSSAVTIEKVTSGDNLSSGAVATYIISQGGTALATKIDIPKDLVLTSGSVVKAYKDADSKISETTSEGATEIKALKLVIANQTDPIYIDVNDLVDKFNAASLVTDKAISAKTSTSGAIDLAAGTTIESALGTIATVADANAKKIEDMDATSNTSDAVAGITVQVDQTDGKISKPVVSVTGGSVAENDASVVTGGTVYTAIKTKVESLDTTADVQAVTLTAATTTDGAKLVFNGVKETDGVIAAGALTSELDLALVATTGKAADVKVAAIGTTNNNVTVAADSTVDAALQTIATAVDANAKALADMDHSETTVATSTTAGEKSDYVTISDGATSGSNDHAYTVKVTEAVYSADSDSFTTDGLVSSTTLNSVLADLWETYSDSSAASDE